MTPFAPIRSLRSLAVPLAWGALLLAPPLGAATLKLDLQDLVLETLQVDRSSTSSRLDEYRDLATGFRLTRLELEGFTEDWQRRARLSIEHGGRDDARYALDYDVAGSWRLELEHDLIPHRFGRNATSLWTRTGPARFEIPDAIQQTLQTFTTANRPTLNYTRLLEALSPHLATAAKIDLGLERHRTGARLELGRASRAVWELDYRHERRNGTRPFGGSFGFSNVTELPEPIDYETRQATIAGSWRFERGLVQLGYRYSAFRNDNLALVWDNPFRATDSTDPGAAGSPGTGSVGGSSRGRAALAPDNDAGGVFAQGRFDLATSGWLRFAVGHHRLRQNDTLLPYTINSAIVSPLLATDPTVLPSPTARRKVATTNGTVESGFRLGEAWQLAARYDIQRYEDESPRLQFPGYVRFHALWLATGRITAPYSWNRETISLTLDRDLGRLGNVGLSLRREDWERELREVDRNVDESIALQWDLRAGPALLRARLERSDRDLKSPYRTEAQHETFLVHGPVNNQPGLRKYDLASRTQDAWNVAVDLPLPREIAVRLYANGADADFDQSELGLLGDRLIQWGLELSLPTGEGSQLFLQADRADRRVDQLGRQSGATLSTNPADNWSIRFTEQNDTWTAGWRKDEGRVRGEIAFDWTRSDGRADMVSPPGGTPDAAVGFDNYEDYDWRVARGWIEYAFRPSLALGIRTSYEHFEIDSFIREGISNYLPGALLLVGNDGNVRAWITGIYLRLDL